MLKISVIIPVYNVKAYLAECLESIMNQTLKELEIICVDDGSTDGSFSLLQEYALKDARIQVFQQQNSGPSVARNLGLTHATGEFVIFMDSDDLYPEKDVLETLYQKATAHQVVICGGELNHFDKEGNSYDNSDYCFEQEGLISYKDYQLDYGYTRFVFQRLFLLENNITFPPYRCFEDPVFFVRAMSLAGQFYALKKDVYAYRTSHKAPSWNEQKILDNLKGFEDNLIISQKYHLDKLHIATAYRVLSPWFAKPISRHLHKKSVFNQLQKTISQINWTILDFSPSDLKKQFKKFQQWNQKLPWTKNHKSIGKFLKKIESLTPYIEQKTKENSQDTLGPILKDYPEIKTSLIVPVYNIENYLPKCLESILEQTHKNIEIICVNDGSTDNSARILEEYAKKDTRIQIITQKNQGLSHARNTGLKQARSEYIVFVDSDDWIEPNTVQYGLNAILSDPEIDFVSYGARLIYEDNVHRAHHANLGDLKYHTITLTGKHEINESTIMDSTVTAWNKLYKKSLIDKHNLVFPVGLLYEDTAFFYKYCLHAKSAYYINQYLYNYVQRSSSIMGSMLKKKSHKITDRLQIFDIVYKYYETNKALEKHAEFINFFFNACLWNDFNHCQKSKSDLVLKFASLLAKNYNPKYFDAGLIRNLVRGKYHRIKTLSYIRPIEKLFSIKNENNRTILRLLGLKIKLKNKKLRSKDELGLLWNKLGQLEHTCELQQKELEKLQDLVLCLQEEKKRMEKKALDN